jgi:hypothetical protein
LLFGLGTLFVFVASLNTDSDIEEALNEKYDADITFERYRGGRSSPSTAARAGAGSRARSATSTTSAWCARRGRTPPLRGTGPSPVE